MYLHAILFCFILQITVTPPKESEEVLICLVDEELVEHSLYIACQSHSVLLEPAKDTHYIICQIGPLE